MRAVLLILALGLGGAGLAPARAAEADACAAFKWPVGREQRAFAAADLARLGPGQALPGLGTAAQVALTPQAEVPYTVKPARPPRNAPAYGAEIAVAPGVEAGTVAVTLSEDAWVDLVQDGKVLHSAGFSGKAGCPGVRKVVRFVRAPGPLTVAISNAPAPSIKLDVRTAD